MLFIYESNVENENYRVNYFTFSLFLTNTRIKHGVRLTSQIQL